MHRLFFSYLGLNEDYNKAMLGIWKLHLNVSSWGACLKDKDDNPKFAFTYTKNETNDYEKCVCVGNFSS
jgi:hypothetical protein